MTPEHFIESSPLYACVKLEAFRPPDSISRSCETPKCSKETTWLKSGGDEGDPVCDEPEDTFCSVDYVCGRCKTSRLVVLFERTDWKSERINNPLNPGTVYRSFAVRKIGQVPPQSTDIPAELGKRLGPSAEHYRKALTCRAENYGIGAMAYLRRVIDDKTNQLIDVMIELAKVSEVPQTEIDRLEGAKKYVRYEEKLKEASNLIPVSLRPGGVNPIGQLYEHTSVAMHGKTDDECIEIFDDIKADFEHIFQNLHLHAERQREFTKRVQARARKKPSLAHSVRQGRCPY